MQIEPLLSGIAEIAAVFRKRKTTVRQWLKDGAPHDVEFTANGRIRRVLVDRRELIDWIRKRK